MTIPLWIVIGLLSLLWILVLASPKDNISEEGNRTLWTITIIAICLIEIARKLH